MLLVVMTVVHSLCPNKVHKESEYKIGLGPKLPDDSRAHGPRCVLFQIKDSRESKTKVTTCAMFKVTEKVSIQILLRKEKTRRENCTYYQC